MQSFEDLIYVDDFYLPKLYEHIKLSDLVLALYSVELEFVDFFVSRMSNEQRDIFVNKHYSLTGVSQENMIKAQQKILATSNRLLAEGIINLDKEIETKKESIDQMKSIKEKLIEHIVFTLHSIRGYCNENEIKIVEVSLVEKSYINNLSLLQNSTTFTFGEMEKKINLIIPIQTASLIFNIMMMEEDNPLENEFDKGGDIYDAAVEYCSQMWGGFYTHYEAETLGSVSYSIDSSSIINGSEYELYKELYLLKLSFKDIEFELIIDIKDSDNDLLYLDQLIKANENQHQKDLEELMDEGKKFNISLNEFEYDKLLAILASELSSGAEVESLFLKAIDADSEYKHPYTKVNKWKAILQNESTQKVFSPDDTEKLFSNNIKDLLVFAIEDILEPLLEIEIESSTLEEVDNFDDGEDKFVGASLELEMYLYKNGIIDFNIPTITSTRFEYLLLGAIGDLKDSIDEDVIDCVREIVYQIGGSLCKIYNKKFSDSDLLSSTLISCSESQIISKPANLYKFTFTYNHDIELYMYITFHDIILETPEDYISEDDGI